MQDTATAPNLLTAHAVAERLGVRLHRVYELVRDERLPAVRIGRTIRVSPVALEAWISAGGTGWPPDDGPAA